MPLVQKQKEEPSLSLWLGRDVPHERELARELLDTMGRDKSLDYLLHLHDREETLRQKRLRLHTGIVLACLTATVGASYTLLYDIAFRPGHHLAALRACDPIIFLCVGVIYTLSLKMGQGKNKKTPYLSSPVQQNMITSLLDYADSPLIAEALARAVGYYTGDRDRLFNRLAHVLALLPDDPDALTNQARQILRRLLSPATVYPYADEKGRTPALQAAIKDYFARTGDPLPSRKGKRADA